MCLVRAPIHDSVLATNRQKQITRPYRTPRYRNPTRFSFFFPSRSFFSEDKTFHDNFDRHYRFGIASCGWFGQTHHRCQLPVVSSGMRGRISWGLPTQTTIV
ncbi:hypothetical protein CDAR_107401 [Caerostris darwini]|uniref:Uncharacterized protein n=1 Tax=Caerostris darwini TaxID=1538125 RepID=A0AAV4NBH1_9ARAC|nr:hypothetical protein CDAR_107401 [Caerostris darwini]